MAHTVAGPARSARPATTRSAGGARVGTAVRRASARRRPDFALDETRTAPAVAEICVRLNEMPLALELAAARTSALAPSQIASRLGDALRVLEGRGSRSAVTRRRTPPGSGAMILDGHERVLFRRPAVFAGSIGAGGRRAGVRRCGPGCRRSARPAGRTVPGAVAARRWDGALLVCWRRSGSSPDQRLRDTVRRPSGSAPAATSSSPLPPRTTRDGHRHHQRLTAGAGP